MMIRVLKTITRIPYSPILSWASLISTLAGVIREISSFWGFDFIGRLQTPFATIFLQNAIEGDRQYSLLLLPLQHPSLFFLTRLRILPSLSLSLCMPFGRWSGFRGWDVQRLSPLILTCFWHSSKILDWWRNDRVTEWLEDSFLRWRSISISSDLLAD